MSSETKLATNQVAEDGLYNTRILVVDDNPDIHDDFRKILLPDQNKEMVSQLGDLEAELFDDEDGTVFASKANIVEKFGKYTYQIDSAYQGEEALQMITEAEAQGQPYALTFMDVRMPPGLDGVETIAKIWSVHPLVEMVLCSAYSDYNWDQIIQKLGITDRLLFIKKPFTGMVLRQMCLSLVEKWNLGHRARQYIENLEGEVGERTEDLEKLLFELRSKNEELAGKNETLTYISHHDGLTQLPNRTLYNDRLRQAIQYSSRYESNFFVSVIDVDLFKQINDEHGHHVGDAVLNEVGKRVQNCLRESDTVARLGGDEFSIIVLNTDNIQVIMSKISTAFETPFEVDGQNVFISLSIGSAIFPEHGETSEALLKSADFAMYEAKQTTHLGLSFAQFGSEISLCQQRDTQMISELSKALENDSFHFNFQPIVDLHDGKTRAIEVLARWQHPVYGFVPPDQFIALAEKHHIISKLTELLFNRALKESAAWLANDSELKLNFNISPKDVFNESFTEMVSCYIAKWQVASNQVCFEITENIELLQSDVGLQTIEQLRALGFELAVDDFGTGFSSLSYLHKLPVKKLKIDKAFIIEMIGNNGSLIIVKSIINLAQALEMKVVAEGVEDQSTMDLLRQMGCDQAQGYHICRPQDHQAMSKWMN